MPFALSYVHEEAVCLLIWAGHWDLMYGHYLWISMPSFELFWVCLCLMHYKNAKEGDSS